MTDDILITITDAEPINIVIGELWPESFIGLSDTPVNYTGKAGLFLKVKADETGLEFGSGSGVGDMLKSVYDADNDGIVDEAEVLDGGTW